MPGTEDEGLKQPQTYSEHASPRNLITLVEPRNITTAALVLVLFNGNAFLFGGNGCTEFCSLAASFSMSFCAYSSRA